MPQIAGSKVKLNQISEILDVAAKARP